MKTIAITMMLAALLACGCNEDSCPAAPNTCGADAGIDGRFDPTADAEGGAVYEYSDIGLRRTEDVLVRVRSNAAHRLTVIWSPGCILENLAPAYEDPNIYRATYEMPITCSDQPIAITDAEVRIDPCGHGSLTFGAGATTGDVVW